MMEWEGLWMMEQEGLWVMKQGLVGLVAEELPPVEQSAPLNIPQTFYTEMLKFLLQCLRHIQGVLCLYLLLV